MRNATSTERPWTWTPPTGHEPYTVYPVTTGRNASSAEQNDAIDQIHRKS